MTLTRSFRDLDKVLLILITDHAQPDCSNLNYWKEQWCLHMWQDNESYKNCCLTIMRCIKFLNTNHAIHKLTCFPPLHVSLLNQTLSWTLNMLIKSVFIQSGMSLKQWSKLAKMFPLWSTQIYQLNLRILSLNSNGSKILRQATKELGELSLFCIKVHRKLKRNVWLSDKNSILMM